MKKEKIHFVGIGGIGMSAIAKVLVNDNVHITGSNLGENSNVKTLKNLGVKIMLEHDTKNIEDDHTLLVISSAIKEDNPEYIEAKRKNIPIIKRSDMLGRIIKKKRGICISGTHGKTSTTAMIGSILETNGLDPTILNGGIINAYSDNAKIGEGKFIVAESDESDGSFVDMNCEISVVTNIEPEHMEFYKTFKNLKNYFEKFIVQPLSNGGISVICIDSPVVKEIYQKIPNKEKIFTYGTNDAADFKVFNVKESIEGLKFDVICKDGEIIQNIFMPMHGEHNTINILAAITIAKHLKIPNNIIKNGLANCFGVQRRFTRVGKVNNTNIIDDYAHHPTEIKATIKGAKAIIDTEKNKVVTVFQPHKYTRTRDLFEEFCEAFFDSDTLILADIYSANQDPIPGITLQKLAEGIRNKGHKNVIELKDEKELTKLLAKNVKNGDIIMCLGAGSISSWSRKLAVELKKIVG
ncbi:UDP-N-acetylmuramate--L-alanine ligase [Pseudomonadota bacterium]